MSQTDAESYALGYQHGCMADLRRWAVQEARATLQVSGYTPTGKEIIDLATILFDFAASAEQPKKKPAKQHRPKKPC